jgi:hypothetical protein
VTDIGILQKLIADENSRVRLAQVGAMDGQLATRTRAILYPKLTVGLTNLRGDA